MSVVIGFGFQSVLPLFQMPWSDFFTLRAVSRADGLQYQHSCIILATADSSFKNRTQASCQSLVAICKQDGIHYGRHHHYLVTSFGHDKLCLFRYIQAYNLLHNCTHITASINRTTGVSKCLPTKPGKDCICKISS